MSLIGQNIKNQSDCWKLAQHRIMLKIILIGSSISLQNKIECLTRCKPVWKQVWSIIGSETGFLYAKHLKLLLWHGGYLKIANIPSLNPPSASFTTHGLRVTCADICASVKLYNTAYCWYGIKNAFWVYQLSCPITFN